MGLGVSELLIIGGIAMFLFGPTVVVGWIAYSVGKNRSEGPPSAPRDPALDAARERFARGEIDAAELEEITRTLGY